MDLKTLFVVGGVAVSLVTGTIAVETRYAHESDLKLVEMRLDQKILQDRYFWIQERYDKLCTGYDRDRPMPVSIETECNMLQRELIDLDYKLRDKEKPKNG